MVKGKGRLNDAELASRTRPRTQLDPNVSILRALRRATREYLVVLDAGIQALSSGVVRDREELTYIRQALQIAAGSHEGRGYSFGTPINIERLLSRALGEAS